MYRLQFHNNPKRILYIFKTQDNVLISDNGTFEWKNLTGQSSDSVRIRFDQETDEGLFTTIVKHSLEVSLVRRNTTQFNDIIDSDDNDWMAVVLEDGTLEFDESDYHLYIDGSACKCLFKGHLNLESYGEDYRLFANVHLTFYDRIGELDDLNFTIYAPQMRLTTILAEILNTCSCSAQIFLEYPFDVFVTGYQNLKSPRNILLDVMSYNNMSKLEVLKKIFYAHGFRLYSDFLPVKDGSDLLSDVGCIRFECIGDLKNIQSTYWKFYLQTISYDSSSGSGSFTKYDYINDEDSSGGSSAAVSEDRTIIQIDTADCLIQERSGQWELVRKAKYIRAINEFELKENILYPDEFLVKDCDYNNDAYSQYWNLKYRYWFDIDPTDSVYQWFDDEFVKSEIRAYVNVVGSSNKLGIKWSSFSSYVIVKKSDSTLKLTGQFFSSLASKTFAFYLIALYNGELYMYNNDTSAWVKTDTHTSAYGFIKTVTNGNAYELETFEDIPQPSFPDGAEYKLLVEFNVQESTDPTSIYYLTDIKLQLVASQVVPKKLEIITTLGETRRNPVEIQPEIYNLPNVPDNLSIYAQGILATGLDKNVGESDEELNTSDIIAPETLRYKENDGTLLVHLSDMYGINHINDRWKFMATIRPINESVVITPDTDTKEATSSTTSSIVGIGGENIIGWSQVQEYGVEFKKAVLGSGDSSGEGEWNVQQEGTTLSQNSFSCNITGLDSDVEYAYRSYVMINSVIYYGEIRYMTTSVYSEFTITVNMDWTDEASGSQDGMSGYVRLRKADGTLISSMAVTPQYCKTWSGVFECDSTMGEVYIDFSDVTAYYLHILTPHYLRWDAGGGWNETDETDTYTTDTVIDTEVQLSSF